VPKEKIPEGPNGGDNDDDGDPGDDDPFGMHPMCCAACRHSISELYASDVELPSTCFNCLQLQRTQTSTTSLLHEQVSRKIDSI
jgi:hypothetical protein